MLINIVHSSVDSGIFHMGSIVFVPLVGGGVGSENAEKGDEGNHSSFGLDGTLVLIDQGE